jgi:tripartite ATP-independent transporter DctP family solute receptor
MVKMVAAVFLICTFAFSTLLVNAEEDPIVFKLAFTDAPKIQIGDDQVYHPSYAAMLAFQNAAQKNSAGKIKVELYPNGRLGDVKSNIEQILAGNLQGATPPDGGLAPFYKNIQVFSIPYLFDNALQAYEILDGPYGQKLFADMAEKSGLRVLAVYDNGGFRNFSNSKKSIKSADDMNGLKFRTMDIPAHMEMVKALGGAPTPIAWLELYGALQTGVVDGQENSAITVLGGSLQEVQKYYTLDGHILGMAFIVTSESWFQSLAPELQDALIKAGKEASFAGRGIVRTSESLAIETLKQKGVDVYAPTPEELKTFKKAQEPVVKWLKENIDPVLVDELVETVAKGGQIAADNQASTQQKQTQSSNSIPYIIIAVLIVAFILFAFFKSRNKKAVA